MKEESQNYRIDPDLEARIVAFVLGEASDLERDELLQLMDQRPELLAVKEQFEGVHLRLCDVAIGQRQADESHADESHADELQVVEDDWKLSAERRSAVLAVIDSESSERPAILSVRRPDEGRGVVAGSFISKFAKLAAVFCVAGFLGWWAVFKLNLQSSRFASSKAIDRDSVPAKSSVEGPMAGAKVFMGDGATVWFDDNTQHVELKAGTALVYEDDAQSSLSGISNSLSGGQTRSVPYFVQEKFQSPPSDSKRLGLGGVSVIDETRPERRFRESREQLGREFSSSYFSGGATVPDISNSATPASESGNSVERASPNLSWAASVGLYGAEQSGTDFEAGVPGRRHWDDLSNLQSKKQRDLGKSSDKERFDSDNRASESREQVSRGLSAMSEPKGRSRSANSKAFEAAGKDGAFKSFSQDVSDDGAVDSIASGDFGIVGGVGGRGIPVDVKAERRSESTGGWAYGGKYQWDEKQQSQSEFNPAENELDAGITRGPGLDAQISSPDQQPGNGSVSDFFAWGIPLNFATPENKPTDLGDNLRRLEERVKKKNKLAETDETEDRGSRLKRNEKEKDFAFDQFSGNLAEIGKQSTHWRWEQQAAERLPRPADPSDFYGEDLLADFAKDGDPGVGLDFNGISGLPITELQLQQNSEAGNSPLLPNRVALDDSVKSRFVIPEVKKTSKLKTSLAKKKAPVSAGLNESIAAESAFSTFSLHVSDVSFKLAQAALARGEWPEAAKIRIEEFVNAFDYGDPMPSQGESVACRLEQSVHPFLQQRNVLRVSMRTAAEGRAASTPLRLTFLLDNSGSMERIDRQQTVRRAFALLAGQLKPMDQVTLISFARQPRLLADKVSGSRSNHLVKMIDDLPSEGGTNIEAALQLAFEKAQEQQTDGAQNRIILLTDGAVNLGDANPDRLSQMIASMRESGIAFDAAGISAEGLNDEILEALTRKGDGRYYLLDSAESADDGFARQIAGALRPSAKNVKVQVEFNPKRVGHYKLLGFEKHLLKTEDFRNDKVDAAEMAAAEAGVAVYQFEAKPDGEGDVGSVSVRFRDLSSGQMVENCWPIPYEADAPRPDQAAPALRIATTAALFAAKLRGEPLGETVDLKTLSELIAGLPDQDRGAKRVGQLQSMIGQARQISGN